MTKKPRHIQDRVDELIKENHITREIIDILKNEGHKVSASYISTRRKKLKDSEVKKETKTLSSDIKISEDSIQLLNDLMIYLGKKDFDETIKVVCNEYMELIRKKFCTG